MAKLILTLFWFFIFYSKRTIARKNTVKRTGINCFMFAFFYTAFASDVMFLLKIKK